MIEYLVTFQIEFTQNTYFYFFIEKTKKTKRGRIYQDTVTTNFSICQLILFINQDCKIKQESKGLNVFFLISGNKVHGYAANLRSS